MDLPAKDLLVLILFLVVLPGATYFALRRKSRVLRITFSLVVFVLGTVAAPNFVTARITESKNSCISNLVVIQEAKRTWAEVNQKGPADVPTIEELLTNSFLTTKPACPVGGTYVVGAMNEEPTCTFPHQPPGQ